MICFKFHPDVDTLDHCVAAKNCKNDEITAGIQARAGSFLPDIRRGNGRAARDQLYRSIKFNSFHLSAHITAYQCMISAARSQNSLALDLTAVFVKRSMITRAKGTQS